jgi:uncharacterized protein (DUF1330 family)
MPACIVAEVVWKDSAAREKYLAEVGPTIEQYDGRTVAGPVEALEGDWRPARLAIVEFESAARARNSDSKILLVPASQ